MACLVPLCVIRHRAGYKERVLYRRRCMSAPSAPQNKRQAGKPRPQLISAVCLHKQAQKTWLHQVYDLSIGWYVVSSSPRLRTSVALLAPFIVISELPPRSRGAVKQLGVR